MAPELPQAVWFQVFDYLRDARAFLQCEVVAKEHRDLLRDEKLGKKLWEARPIAYGDRLFATGGTAYAEEEREDVNDEYLAGTVGWTERHNDEICEGGQPEGDQRPRSPPRPEGRDWAGKPRRRDLRGRAVGTRARARARAFDPLIWRRPTLYLTSTASSSCTPVLVLLSCVSTGCISKM